MSERQLEPGEFAYGVLRACGLYRSQWGRASNFTRAGMAAVEAACIAKGRAEAEARIEELQRDSDDHCRNRSLLATDLISLTRELGLHVGT